MTTANSNSSPSAYLRTKILTASPQELRILLYDGAVKFCRQARHALEKHEFESMYNAIIRAQKVVTELSTSLDHASDPELCGKLAGLYNYIYLRLVDANMERDTARLDEAIRLLEYQRETWMLAIKKSRGSQDEPAATASGLDPQPVAPVEQSNPIASIGPTKAVRPGAAFNTTPPALSSFSVQG